MNKEEKLKVILANTKQIEIFLVITNLSYVKIFFKSMTQATFGF